MAEPERSVQGSVEKQTRGIRFVVGRPKGKTTTEVQTVIFSKQFWNAGSARRWLRENGMRADGKLDVTENSLRFRQKPPGRFQPGSFRTISPGRRAS